MAVRSAQIALSPQSSDLKRSRSLHWSWPRWRFAAGLVCGVALVAAGRLAINRTSFADHLVRPLLRSDTRGPADAIVVMGAGIMGPCLPNHNAMQRTLAASRLWRHGRAPVIVFTGGPPRGELCPVSTVMAQFARELGVPESRILLERASKNTHENALFSESILRQAGATRLLVVTDRLHMPRASGVFRQRGFHIEMASVPVYAGHRDNVSMLLSGLREYVALAYYRARGWIGRSPERLAAGVPAAGPGAGEESGGMNEGVKHPNGPIVILGASYAGGWQPGSLAGVQTITKGVSGQQSFQVLERFDRDVLPAQPRAVILWGFINDIFRSPRPEVDRAKARIRESFTKMIAQARAAGIEPILATEVTVRPKNEWGEMIAGWIGALMGKESYQDYINSHVIEVNDWLRDLARRENLLLLDLQPVVSDPSGLRRQEYAKDDGSHITPAGYDAMTSYANPILERHFRSR